MENKTDRQLALEWWNSHNKKKCCDELFIEYKEQNFTPAQDSNGLTGREIEMIWRKENPGVVENTMEAALINFLNTYKKGARQSGFTYSTFKAGSEWKEQQLEPLIKSHKVLLEVLKEVIAISDRKHDVWDRAKEAIIVAGKI